MMQKAQKSNILTLNKLINAAFGDIQTSFSNTDLLALATKVFSYDIGDTTGFPYEKTTHKYDKIGDVVIPCDLASNVTQLHQFLFNDEIIPHLQQFFQTASRSSLIQDINRETAIKAVSLFVS